MVVAPKSTTSAWDKLGATLELVAREGAMCQDGPNMKVSRSRERFKLQAAMEIRLMCSGDSVVIRDPGGPPMSSRFLAARHWLGSVHCKGTVIWEENDVDGDALVVDRY